MLKTNWKHTNNSRLLICTFAKVIQLNLILKGKGQNWTYDYHDLEEACLKSGKASDLDGNVISFNLYNKQEREKIDEIMYADISLSVVHWNLVEMLTGRFSIES